MRLIDADRLKADMERQALGGWQKQVMRCVIADQPTAYDVDKVIEELHTAPYLHGECGHIETDEAIDIVRRGGVE